MSTKKIGMYTDVYNKYTLLYTSTGGCIRVYTSPGRSGAHYTTPHYPPRKKIGSVCMYTASPAPLLFSVQRTEIAIYSDLPAFFFRPIWLRVRCGNYLYSLPLVIPYILQALCPGCPLFVWVVRAHRVNTTNLLGVCTFQINGLRL